MDRPVRVMHVSTAGTWRGGEQQVCHLMAALRLRGLEQGLFCAEGSAIAREAARIGIAVHTYRRWMRTGPAAWRIRTLCRRHAVEVLHAHDSGAHTMAWLAKLLGLRCRLVVHRRVDFPVGRHKLSRWKYRHDATDHYICLTQAIAAVLGRTVPGHRMSVVPSGVDLRVFEPWWEPAARKAARAWLRTELGVGPETVVILNAAALAGHKDQATYLRVAASFLGADKPMAWVVAGADAGEGMELRRLIEELGLTGAVHLLGFRTDVPRIMAGSDLFLFTSRMEGMGSVLLEAFASRLPVVTTDAGGITAVVRHGSNGLVAPVGDAAALSALVRDLLADEGLRERLTARATADLAGFSREKMAERIVRIYEKIRTVGST